MRSILRSHPIGWLAALAMAGALGCSFIVDFDPEGKPCDSNGACLEGYVCNESNVCIPEPPPSDGGTDGGLDDGGIPEFDGSIPDFDASIPEFDAGFDAGL